MNKFYILEPIDGVRYSAETPKDAHQAIDAMSEIDGPGVVVVCHLATTKQEIIAGLNQAIKYANKDLYQLPK